MSSLAVLISEQGINPLHQGTSFSFYCMKTYPLEIEARVCLALGGIALPLQKECRFS